MTQRTLSMTGLFGGALGLVVAAGSAAGQVPGLPDADVALEVEGADLVNADGEVVTLRLINLGNWLLLESWMYGQDSNAIRDQATFINVLRARFGAAAADALIESHRDGYITQRDFDIIAASGFNGVRIPVSHIALEREPFVADEAGLDRLLTAVRRAAAAGLYVVIDMHSVPGGQSTDQPSGDVTANDLWTDAEAQERLVWLWQRVARELKNEPNFIAYDLINEPYGDFQTDLRPVLLGIVDRVIEGIRRVDPNRLIYVPGALEGIRFYGDPADRGWENVGFTEHFYPGLFDGRPATLGTQARFFESTLRDRADYARGLGVPYLWGEFNPVFDRAGNVEVIRSAMDRASDLGVGAAVWSYKRMLPPGGQPGGSWELVANQGPLPFSDIRTASLGALQSGFGSLATLPLVVDNEYVAAMTGPAISGVLPTVVSPPLVAPAQDDWPLWSVSDVGVADRPGGQVVAGAGPLGADSVTLFTSGDDLFGRSDSLRLASRNGPPEFVMSAVVDAFDAGRFAKAGVTLRASESPSSAHVSLAAFPDGRVLVTTRSVTSASTQQRFIGNSGFPVGLAVSRVGGSFDAWMTDADGVWRSVPLFESASVGTSPLGGVFATSNGSGTLNAVRFAEPMISPPGTVLGAIALDDGVNLLSNASFEALGSGGVADWSLSGAAIGREVGWVPVRDGSSLLAYRHWQVTSGASSDASQTLTGLTPGERYVFTVYANRDTVSGGASTAESVELRVETTDTPALWLESVTFDGNDIATGSEWSRLQVRFTATRPEHVARVVFEPGSAPRDGAVKLDGLFLEVDPG